MQEKMSLVLEAVTNGFKSKMQEAGNFGQQMANKVKQAWNIEPKINTKNLSTTQNQTKGLKQALSNYKRADFSNLTPGVKTYTNSLVGANKNMVLL